MRICKEHHTGTALCIAAYARCPHQCAAHVTIRRQIELAIVGRIELCGRAKALYVAVLAALLVIRAIGIGHFVNIYRITGPRATHFVASYGTLALVVLDKSHRLRILTINAHQSRTDVAGRINKAIIHVHKYDMAAVVLIRAAKPVVGIAGIALTVGRGPKVFSALPLFALHIIKLVKQSGVVHQTIAVVFQVSAEQPQHVYELHLRVITKVLDVLPRLLHIDVVLRFRQAITLTAAISIAVTRKALVLACTCHNFSRTTDVHHHALQRVLPFKEPVLNRRHTRRHLCGLIKWQVHLRGKQGPQARFKPTVYGQAAPTALVILAQTELGEVFAHKVYIRFKSKTPLGICHSGTLYALARKGIASIPVATQVERHAGIRFSLVVVAIDSATHNQFILNRLPQFERIATAHHIKSVSLPPLHPQQQVEHAPVCRIIAHKVQVGTVDIATHLRGKQQVGSHTPVGRLRYVALLIAHSHRHHGTAHRPLVGINGLDGDNSGRERVVLGRILPHVERGHAQSVGMVERHPKQAVGKAAPVGTKQFEPVHAATQSSLWHKQLHRLHAHRKGVKVAHILAVKHGQTEQVVKTCQRVGSCHHHVDPLSCHISRQRIALHRVGQRQLLSFDTLHFALHVEMVAAHRGIAVVKTGRQVKVAHTFILRLGRKGKRTVGMEHTYGVVYRIAASVGQLKCQTLPHPADAVSALGVKGEHAVVRLCHGIRPRTSQTQVGVTLNTGNVELRDVGLCGCNRFLLRISAHRKHRYHTRVAGSLAPVHHFTRVSSYFVVAGMHRHGQTHSTVCRAHTVEFEQLFAHLLAVGIIQFNIQHAAERSRLQRRGAHHVCLVPQGVALKVGRIVKVQIHLLTRKVIVKTCRSLELCKQGLHIACWLRLAHKCEQQHDGK